MVIKTLIYLFTLLVGLQLTANGQSSVEVRQAPAPLFRDPITDGAADPVVVWNKEEKSWWMLYTQRRANSETADVAYCYGNPIAIASTHDHGKTWVYRGTLDLEFEKGHNTFWAPDVIYYKGRYHMFVAYIPGVRNHWSGSAKMVHYSSKDLWKWKLDDFPKLPFENVIDATLLQAPDGKWKMWYKGPGSLTMLAESKDLKRWTGTKGPAIGGDPHEGAKVFRFGEWYWMLTDEWKGMRIYRSKDLANWEKQGLILSGPSKRKDDTPNGAHGDVVVVGEKAYVFYFTHPGRKHHGESQADENGNLPYSLRRSSIQVAELTIQDNTLICDRDRPFDFWLPTL